MNTRISKQYLVLSLNKIITIPYIMNTRIYNEHTNKHASKDDSEFAEAISLSMSSIFSLP
jgi:hypothetical protein